MRLKQSRMGAALALVLSPGQRAVVRHVRVVSRCAERQLRAAARGGEQPGRKSRVQSGHAHAASAPPSPITQIGSDVTSSDSNFGSTLALSANGNRVAVTAYGTANGTTRVYERSGSTWAQIGADIIGEAAGQRSAQPQLGALRADHRHSTICRAHVADGGG